MFTRPKPKFWPDVKNDLFYTKHFHENEKLGEVYVTFDRKPTARDKFEYVYGVLKAANKLPVKLKGNDAKNNDVARRLRNDAKEALENEQYGFALAQYNESLTTAKPYGHDYVLALAYRSAALFHLGEYDACVRNIRLAYESGVPDDIVYELYDRETRCLLKLGKISEAKAKFQVLTSHLAQVVLPDDKKKSIETEIEALFKESQKAGNNEVNEEKHVIKLLKGPNKNISALSNVVKLKYSESMGRCLIVTSDVRPGDVLCIEKPYTGSIKTDLGSSSLNCHYCFKLCLNGIPCLKCRTILFCNEHCRLKSFEKSHKYECILTATFQNTASMCSMERLSLNIFLTTFCKLGLDKYIATVCSLNACNTDPILRGFNAQGKYLSDEFCSVYALEGNESKRTVQDLFMRHCYAAALTSLIGLAGIKIPDHQLGIVGESLVHILCVVASNAHEIDQPLKHKTWNTRSIRCLRTRTPVADLLLPVLSLLNHRCDPNVVRHNYNGTVVLRAIQPISKNTELFDNYGKLYATDPKNIRQSALKNQYCFDCHCDPCNEDWPLYGRLRGLLDTTFPLLDNFDETLWMDQRSKMYEIIQEVQDKDIHDPKHLPYLYSYLQYVYGYMLPFGGPFIEYCDCQEVIKEILFKTADKFSIQD